VAGDTKNCHDMLIYARTNYHTSNKTQYWLSD